MAESMAMLEQVDPAFEIMYDRASAFWKLLYYVMRECNLKPRTWMVFWASQQRFFRQMLMAAKV